MNAPSLSSKGLHAVESRPPRSTSHKPWTLAAALAGALVAAHRPARAQSASGWALGRYEPATAGDAFFVNEHPWYNRTRLVSFGLTSDFARNPLVIRAPNAAPQVVIDNMLTLHAHGAIALFDRVAISVSMPVSLLQTAGAASGASATGLSAYTASPAPGDPRLGLRARIFGHSDEDPVSLHIGGQIFIGFIPWSGDEHWVTDEALRGRLTLTLAGRVGPLRHTFSTGYHFRRRTELARTVMDGDLFLSAGLALAALDDRLHVGPEFWINLVPGSFGVANTDATINAEATLGIAYTLANVVELGVAGGPGLTGSAGTPTFRGLFRLAYRPGRAEPAPSPADGDGDGVVDHEDQCPTEAAGARPDASRPGCPAPRTDHDEDGIFDDVDLCPDEPVGRTPDPGRPGCALPDQDEDGVADTIDACRDAHQGEHPDPERPGCPDGDEDGDGVRDHEDACRARAQGPTPDPERPGCPAPDTDGDTVGDPVDRCVDRPGIPSADPAQRGCPTALLSFDGAQLRLAAPVEFAADGERLTPASLGRLTEVAAAISALPVDIVFEIQVHVDAATARARPALAQRRAAVIHRALVERGVAASRIEARGLSAERPLVDERGLRGPALSSARARNRRVEFVARTPASRTPPSPSTTSAPAASPSPEP